MIKNVFFFLAVFALKTGFAQTINPMDSSWIRDNYSKIEQTIPMRDGIKLFTSVYMPKDKSEQHPILLLRTPYSCAPYGANNWLPFWEGYLRYYMREGYIIAFQDVRGKWMSEGEFEDVRPFRKDKKAPTDTDEASDAYDTIDWLTKNMAGNNGKVGVMGISYPGFYATMAAASGHPALKAVSPQAPVTDWFMGDDFHHNGAFFVLDGFSFYAGRGFGFRRPQTTTLAPVVNLPLAKNDNYDTYLKIGSLQNFWKLTGDSIRFWNDLYAHPNYDDWWKARNARVAMYNIKPAMLTVGGLFDAEDCFGAWNLYKAIEKQSPSTNNKIVMGPWYHGQWSGKDGSSLGNIKFGSFTSQWYQNNIEIPFFNYYLKGKGEDPQLAEATVFFSGENNWKKFTEWPPATSIPRSIYLQPNGKLGWTKPTIKNNFTEYVSDPAHPVPYTEDVHYNRTREYMTDDQRFASRRTDVVTFQTNSLPEDLTLAGPVAANLIVSMSGTDADFVVKIIDVFPDDYKYEDSKLQENKTNSVIVPMGGYQMLVRGEIMRGKFRNSFEKPEPFISNKSAAVKFTLPDVAHTFKKGHKLMIQIQSSWFPLSDRNPQKFMNIYEAVDSDFQKANIRIYHDTVNSSEIILPVIK